MKTLSFLFCSKHLFILWDNSSALRGQNSFVSRVWIGLEVQSFHGRLFCKCDRWCWSVEQKSEIVYLTCHAVLLPPSYWFQQALKFHHQNWKHPYMYLWKDDAYQLWGTVNFLQLLKHNFLTKKVEHLWDINEGGICSSWHFSALA